MPNNYMADLPSKQVFVTRLAAYLKRYVGNRVTIIPGHCPERNIPMIRAIAAIFVLCLSSLCFAADDTQEPPLKYTLEIDGQAHVVVLDKPVKIHGVYSNPNAVLRASSIRYFTYGDLSFQYPASFTWEAEIVDHKKGATD
jgi:hypothetical protein